MEYYSISLMSSNPRAYKREESGVNIANTDLSEIVGGEGEINQTVPEISHQDELNISQLLARLLTYQSMENY